MIKNITFIIVKENTSRDEDVKIFHTSFSQTQYLNILKHEMYTDKMTNISSILTIDIN